MVKTSDFNDEISDFSDDISDSILVNRGSK